VNRHKYIASTPYRGLMIGQIIQHRREAHVQGMVSHIDLNGLITIIYGRMVDGIYGNKFQRAQIFENMMDSDEIKFEDVEDVDCTFVVPRVYE